MHQKLYLHGLPGKPLNEIKRELQKELANEQEIHKYAVLEMPGYLMSSFAFYVSLGS